MNKWIKITTIPHVRDPAQIKRFLDALDWFYYEGVYDKLDFEIEHGRDYPKIRKTPKDKREIKITFKTKQSIDDFVDFLRELKRKNN